MCVLRCCVIRFSLLAVIFAVFSKYLPLIMNNTFKAFTINYKQYVLSTEVLLITTIVCSFKAFATNYK